MSTSLKFDQTDLEKTAGVAPQDEQLVIACPGCATRFGIERSVVAAVSSPRFHCSKCDHTFGMHETFGAHTADNRPRFLAALTEPGQSYTPSPLTPPTLRAVGKAAALGSPAAGGSVNGSSVNGSSVNGGSVNGSSVNRGTSKLPNNANFQNADLQNLTEGVIAVYRNSAKVESVTTRSADTAATLDIPKHWDGSMRAAEPRETASAYSDEEEYFTGPGVGDESTAANNTGQIAFDFSARPRSKPVTASSNGALQSTPDPIAYGETLEIASFGTVQNSPLWDTSDAEGGALHADRSPARLSSLATHAIPATSAGASVKRPLSTKSPSTPRPHQLMAQSNSKSSRPTMTKAIVLPMMAFFLFLVGVSVALRGNQSLSARFISATLPGALQAAPSELYIRNSRFQKITLDSGEVVRVISGTIVNSGQRNFHDVQVEVVSFNAVGKPLGLVRANAAATLAKTKIHSLTPEMIEELQKSSNARRLILKPGDQRDFAIAMLGNDYAPSRHFAARIFSAKSF